MRIERLLHFDDMAMTCGYMRAYGYSPKPMIGTILGTAAAIGSSIWGGVKSAQQNAAAKREMELQDARDEAWYKRNRWSDYLDSAAGQNLYRQAKDYANNNWQHAHGAAAVGGGTDAAVAMAKESGNKMVGDTVANIAAHDSSNKMTIEGMHRQDQKASSSNKVALNQKSANDIAQVAGATSDALMKAGVAYDGFNSGSTAPNNTKKTAGDFLAGSNSKDFSFWG